MTTIGVGDVWAVETSGFTGDLIRLGADLEGEPTPASHVVMAHHIDARGRWQGIQGQPGGVGWVDMTQYITGPLAKYANSNADQPRTTEQRTALAQVGEGLLKIGYDWVGGIVADGLDDFHQATLAKLIDHYWGWTDLKHPNVAPGHVVCSSAWAYAYWVLKLVCPIGPNADPETVQPANWWIFNGNKKWTVGV